MADLDNCSVLFVIPPARFKDEELDTPRKFLERKKVKIKIASSATRDSYGMGGLRARPDLTLDAVTVDDYDAIVFVGGMGTRDFWDHAGAHELARCAVAGGRIVGATSTAPVILARAGLLDGKEATVYFSETKQITERGASYTAAPVTVDGNIITCKGPESVEKFALALLKHLGERRAEPA